MKIEEMQAIAEKLTFVPPNRIDVDGCQYYLAKEHAESVAMAANNWDALMKVVKAAKILKKEIPPNDVPWNIPYQKLCKSLKELEAESCS